MDRAGARIPEHAHDWPVLSLFVMGGYCNETETGATLIDGPSAILYGAGTMHRNAIGENGFEQLEIEFDPAWLGHPPVDRPVSHWVGGRAGGAARDLAHLCGSGTNEWQLRSALCRYFESAPREKLPEPPRWTSDVTRRLRQNPSLKIGEIANALDLHPSWLGSAYKSATGESVQQTAARYRVERAARQLRETDGSYADIASDCSFCDQSHMNRTFQRVLGRTPSTVRGDRQSFRGEQCLKGAN
ncbi:MAG TPA: AraC family transcriptional regulator [Rhizomicrobium sp.]|nr:AraC family transcriptional regulator [Rhizomicrobium sp.]